MRLAASFLIWVLAWLPMVIISLPVVAFKLRTDWPGTTTWFGNYLYGRYGNSHVPKNHSLWQQWLFLCIRNPVSNFGKFVISTSAENAWAWREDKHLFGRLYLLYGWKDPDDRLPGIRRPFVFRLWVHE